MRFWDDVHFTRVNEKKERWLDAAATSCDSFKRYELEFSQLLKNWTNYKSLEVSSNDV